MFNSTEETEFSFQLLSKLGGIKLEEDLLLPDTGWRKIIQNS